MPGGWRGADGPAADRRGESAGRRTAILHEVSWVKWLDYGKSPVGSPRRRGPGRISVRFRPRNPTGRGAMTGFGHNGLIDWNREIFCALYARPEHPKPASGGRFESRSPTRPSTCSPCSSSAPATSSPGRRSSTSVWPDTHVHPDNVKVLIGEIRRALGDDPVRPQFIRSLVKRGYIFIAPVVDAPADLSAGSCVAHLCRARNGDGAPARRPRRGGGFATAGRLRDGRRRHRQDRALRGVSSRRRDASADAGDAGRSACGSRDHPNRTTRCSTCSPASRARPTTKRSPPRCRDWRRAGCRTCPASPTIAPARSPRAHTWPPLPGCCARS